jgi:hypothetical protein
MTIRKSLAGLALSVTAAGVAVLGAGCAQSSEPTSTSGASGAPSVPSTGAPAGAGATDQRSALLGSAQRLSQTTYKYRTVAGELTTNGAVDPVNKASSGTVTGTNKGNSLTVDMAAVGTDVWLRLNLGAADQPLGITTNKWLHVDAARLGANSTLPLDPSGGAAVAGAVLAGVVDVHSTDNRHFTGTVDLTKAGSPVTSQLLAQAGAPAKPMPFTADADGQGRLTNVTVDMSSVAAGMQLAISFSDFGTPVTVTRPDAAQVAEAPQSVYTLFGH